jgi:hypothetical protein
MRPETAVAGHGWNVSFQRRVGKDNLGALPCLLLSPASDRLRVLVPLRDGEALWVAVLAEPTITLEGYAGPYRLRASVVSQSIGHQSLLALDGILVGERWAPLDATSLPRASCRNEIDIDGLTIRLGSDSWSQELAVVLATPALYESVSGFPLPQATFDSYGGWRLP